MTNEPGVRGFNHLTLAVSDIDRSIAFYRDLLGFELRACWSEGAYLEAGALWLCLSLEPDMNNVARNDYTHYAFDVRPEDFEALRLKVEQNARLWRENRSEGPSVYFLDPDGHKLELHVGGLTTRLKHYADKKTNHIRLFGDTTTRPGHVS